MRLKVNKIVFGGQGLGYYDDRPVFLWNVLPHEEVEFETTKRKRSHWEGVATTILSASPDRISPTEPHYLSSSPWGMMNFEAEQRYKVNIARETYSHIGKIDLPDDLEIVTDGKEYEYRNKIEFSFYEFDENDARGRGISLAFFQRGQKYKVPITTSTLAEPVINDVAQYILEWVRTQPLGRRELKSLIIRSNGRGQAIAALFIKDKMQFAQYPKLTPQLLGFHIYYSSHKSPASVPHELLYAAGEDHITYTVHDVQLETGLLGFFQVNVGVFTLALCDIQPWIQSGTDLLDLYSGVGAIGLPLGRTCRSVELIDNNAEAIASAQRNIQQNGFTQAKALTAPAEAVIQSIQSHHTVVIDPPRAGLHEKVVQRLLEVRPKTIVYLSCNIATQARDLQLLSAGYTIECMRLYNFFPRTPHIEGLSVLTAH